MALTLQQRIDDAKAKYHALVVGTSPRVIVDQNGERVEYTPANANRLKAYIQALEDELAGRSTRGGPMKVWLG